MNRRIFSWLIFITLFAAATKISASPPIAGFTNKKPDVVCLEFYYSLRIDNNERATLHFKTTCTVLTEDGVMRKRQQYFAHSSSSDDSIKIINASVVGADRKQRRGMTREISEPVAFEAARIQTVVSFPDMNRGDQYTIEFERSTSTKTMSRGVNLVAFGIDPIDRIEVLVSAPTGDVQVESIALQELAHQRSGGRESWRWAGSIKDVLNVSRDLDENDFRPRVAVAFLKSYLELSRAISKSYDSAEVTATRAQSIAMKLSNPGDSIETRARLAYKWIQQNIRFEDSQEASKDRGLDPFAPSPVNSTIERGNGVCRDLVAVYEVLLRSLKIRAEPVFINNAENHWQPSIPVSLHWNHVITYLPDLKVFTDVTNRDLPFGVLNPQLSMKTGLNMRSGQLVTTPYSADWLGEDDATEISITETGSAKGRTVLHFSGDLAATVRGSLEKRKQQNTLEKFTQGLLRINKIDGHGSVQLDVDHSAGSYSYAIDYVFQLPWKMKAKSIEINPPSLSYLQFKSMLFNDDNHDWSLCSQYHQKENIIIHFPATYTIPELPRQSHFSNSVAEYDAEYSKKGTDLHIQRKFKTHWPTSVCHREEKIASLKEIDANIQRDKENLIVVHHR